jgi:tetratricopeptide (TPR) repeat protein
MQGSWGIAAMGGGVRVRHAAVFLALGLTVIVPGGSRGEEPAAKDWVGKRVVQKYNNFPVRVDGEPVLGSGEKFSIYRVQRVDGGRLWLKAEGEGEEAGGSGAVGQFVPVDQAIPFFTARIHSHPDDVFSYVMRASLWEDQNEFDRAVEDYTEIIRMEPQPGAYIGRGNAWLGKQDADKAIADFDEAIRLDANAIPAFTGRGNARQLKQEYDKAIADYDQAIRLSPNDMVALYSRGHALAEKGDYDRAITDFDRALRLDPRSVVALNGRGLVRHHKKEYDKAIADYDEALRIDPKNAAVYYNRGLAWQFKDEFIKAVNDYDQAVRLDPRYAAASRVRGPALAPGGDDAEPLADPFDLAPPAPAPPGGGAGAIDALVVPAGDNGPFGNFSRNLQRDLAYADLCMQRAYEWGGAKDYDRAITDFNEALRLNPHLAGAYIGRGHARCEKKEYDKAIADYDQALQIDPHALTALLGRARAREIQGEHQKAFADFDQAVRLDPQSQMAYLGRAFAWQQKKEYAKAIADYDEAIRLNPELGAVYVGRAHARSQAKDYDRALADLDRAIELGPDNAQAYNNRAWLWATCPDAKARDGKKAIESATKACELTEWKEPGLIDTLAAAYAEAGDFDAAVKWQTRANPLFTQAEEKTEGEQRLELYRAKKPYRDTKP